MRRLPRVWQVSSAAAGRRLGGLCIGLSLALSVTEAAAADVGGVWEVEDGEAHVRIEPCDAGLCGEIVWLKEPADAQGNPRLDSRNEDPRARGRPLLGLQLLGNFKRGPGSRWEGGLIYNPEDGQTYRVDLEVADPNTLKVRGCLLVFCQEQLWRRVR